MPDRREFQEFAEFLAGLFTLLGGFGAVSVGHHAFGDVSFLGFSDVQGFTIDERVTFDA